MPTTNTKNTVTVIYSRADGTQTTRNLTLQEAENIVKTGCFHTTTVSVYDAADNLIGERHPVIPGDEPNESNPYVPWWFDIASTWH